MIQQISQARSLSDFHDDEERTCVATITISKIPPSLAEVKPTTATCPLAECLLGLGSDFSAVKIDAHGASKGSRPRVMPRMRTMA